MRLLGVASIAVAGAFAGYLGAEEVAAEASAAAEAGGETPASPPGKARDSEIMPRSAYALLLDIVNTGSHLLAVGEHGSIVVSNDGVKWEQVKAPVRSPLTAITFVDAQNGWAVGHDAAIVKTSDGGKTWVLQNFQPELEKPLLDVLFLDGTNGFAVGAYGLFLKTSDGGGTWTEVDAPAVRGGETHLNAMTKLDNGNLLIVGEQGMIAVSADNGATWSKLKSPYDSSFFGAIASGATGAIIYGLRGNVYKMDDITLAEKEAVEGGLEADPAADPAAPVTGSAAVADPAVTDTAAAVPAEPAPASDPAVAAADPAAVPVAGTGAVADPALAAPTGVAWTKVETNSTATFFSAVKLSSGELVFVGLRGAVLKMTADGSSPQSLKVSEKEVTASGERDKEISSTYSSAIPWKAGLLLVGEEGIKSLRAFN